MRFLLPHSKGETAATFYTDFHAGIARALRELGHEVLVFGFEDIERSSPEEQQILYRLLVRQPCDAVLDLCCWSHCLSQGRVWDGAAGEPLFDSQDMAYVGLLFDQPWYQPLAEVRSHRLFAAVPDQANVEQLPLIYPELRLSGTALMLPAIDAASDCSRGDIQRDIPLLYVGTLHAAALERDWSGMAEAAICDAVADLALEQPRLPLHEALREVLVSLGQPWSATLALAVLRKVEYFRRHHLRLRAVRNAAASGVPMLLVGEGWEGVELPANVQRHAPVDYPGMRALAARARLCLDASTYVQGGNDRIFNYLVNGAVCLTNSRGSLEAAAAGGGLLFHDINEGDALGATIRDWLARPRALEEESARARVNALSSHTWRHRMQALIGLIGASG